MSTPTPNPSFEQWLLTTIQSDVLTIGGAPLLTLLTNLKAHAGNELMQGADWLQFLAASPACGSSVHRYIRAAGSWGVDHEAASGAGR